MKGGRGMNVSQIDKMTRKGVMTKIVNEPAGWEESNNKGTEEWVELRKTQI